MKGLYIKIDLKRDMEEMHNDFNWLRMELRVQALVNTIIKGSAM
jgi:hypothetical protein